MLRMRCGVRTTMSATWCSYVNCASTLPTFRATPHQLFYITKCTKFAIIPGVLSRIQVNIVSRYFELPGYQVLDVLQSRYLRYRMGSWPACCTVCTQTNNDRQLCVHPSPGILYVILSCSSTLLNHQCRTPVGLNENKTISNFISILHIPQQMNPLSTCW